VIKLLCIILVLLTALAAGIYPFLKRLKTNKGYDFPLGEALAAGIFLGAGLMHMLGDSAQNFIDKGYSYPIPFLLAGLMFLFLLWLEHLGAEIYTHKGANNPGFAILAFIMLSIHSFLAGAALGLSSQLSVVIVLLLAIIAHKWAASFALAVQISKTTLPIHIGIILFLIFSLMTPLGILVGDVIAHSLYHASLLESIFSALAAGTFLYLGTLHGLSSSIMVSKCCNLKHFSFVILGFVLMAIIAIWA